MADLSKLSDSDLDALARNDIRSLSDEGLEILSGEKINQTKSAEPKQSWGDLLKSGIKKTATEAADVPIGGINALLNLAKGAVNLPSHLRGKQPIITGEYQIPTFEKGDVGSKVGEFIGPAFIPFIGQINMLRRISQIPKLAAQVGDIALTGGGLSTLAAANEPNASLLKAFGEGAELSGGLSGAGRLAQHFLPPNVLQRMMEARGVTPENVAQAQENLGETPANILNVIRAPRLGRMIEEIQKFLPFSGVSKKRAELVDKAQNETTNFIDELTGGLEHHEIGNELENKITKNFEKRHKKAKKGYSEIINEAQKSDIKLPGKKIMSTVKNIIDENESSILPTYGENILSHLRKYKENYSDNPEIDFKKAHFQHGKLGEIAREQWLQGNNANASVAEKLRKSFKDEMEEAAKNKNSNVYKKLLKQNKKYREDVAPYYNRDIMNIKANKTRPEDIHKALMKRENEAVLGHLDKSGKNLVGYQLLSPAGRLNEFGEFEFSPASVARKFSELQKKSPALIKQVYTPEQIKKLEKINMLSNLAHEGKLEERPPATGYRNVEMMQELTKGLGGLHAALNPAQLPWLIGASGINRAVANYLMSPKLRKKLSRPRRQENFITSLLQSLAIPSGAAVGQNVGEDSNANNL